jgi:hypothetical protein
MKRLIFTTSDSGAGCLRQPGIADAVVPVGRRFFIRESLPSDVEIASSLEEDDWLGRIYRKYAQQTDRSTRIIDLCEPFEVIDLWIDPDPNAQLILIWMLEYLRPYEAIVSKLNLVQADVPIGNYPAEEVVEWRIPAIKRRNGHLEMASSVWQAYRAPTPQAWFNLLSTDLSALPLFRPAAVALLEELPGARDWAWRHGNADIGADLGRRCRPVRCFPRPREAQHASDARLLADRRSAGRFGALSGARRVGPG